MCSNSSLVRVRGASKAYLRGLKRTVTVMFSFGRLSLSEVVLLGANESFLDRKGASLAADGKTGGAG